MTIPNLKLVNVQSRKPLINNSFSFARHNKSRSLLKNSVLRCTLKSNNIELAKSLAAVETELCELRKENTRLLRENYDVTHTGRFRAVNYDDFMGKFYELTEVAETLFSGVCRLSDTLLQLQNCPFIMAEECNVDADRTKIPSPFVPRDKIQRSPPPNSTVVNVMQPIHTANSLASKVTEVKNRLSHSIHNLTVNPNSSFSIRRKSINLTNDTSDQNKFNSNGEVPPSDTAHNTSFSSALQSKITTRKTRTILPEDKIVKEKSSQRKLVNNKDPMFSTDRNKTKTSRKKKNLKLKGEINQPNKEEYKKRKEEDPFYLSRNETFNASVVSTLKQFNKKQQEMDSDNTKTQENHTEKEKLNENDKISVQCTGFTALCTKIVPTSIDSTSKPKKSKIDFPEKNDDSDFILPEGQVKCQLTQEPVVAKENILTDISPQLNIKKIISTKENPDLLGSVSKKQNTNRGKSQKQPKQLKENSNPDENNRYVVLNDLSSPGLDVEDKTKNKKPARSKNTGNKQKVKKRSLNDDELPVVMKETDNVDMDKTLVEDKHINTEEVIESLPRRKRAPVNYCMSPVKPSKKRRKNA